MNRSVIAISLAAVAALAVACGSSSTADKTGTETTAAGGGAGSSGGSGSSDPIVVGAVYNVSGSEASIDDPGLKGFQLAAELINAKGGVLGRQIKVAYADGQSDKTTLTNVTSELINNDHAVALGGTNDSTFALAVGPIAQSAGIPFVVAGATLPTLPDQVGDDLFMVPYGDNVQAGAIADFASGELHAKTAWALVDQAFDFTTALNKFFQKQWVADGGKIVLEDTYKSGDTDFSAQIARLKALPEQPDLLFVASIPNEAGIITQQIRAAGLTQPIISGDGFDTPLVGEIAGDLANDVYYSTHMSLDSDKPEIKDFIKAYTDKYGKAPENAFGALGFDTMNLIADAIERAGSASPQAIRDALANTHDFKAVTGTISYENGSRVPKKSVTIMELKQGKPSFVSEVTP